MLSFKEIAKEFHCSKDTVKIWIHRYQETQDIQDQEKTGRKRKTSEKEDTNIITTAKRLRSSSSTEISTSISKQGFDISSTTVRRRLNEQGLYKLQPLKKPLLSDTNRHNRLKWAKNNKNVTGLRLFLQMSQPSLSLVNQKKSGKKKVKRLK